MIFIRIFCGQRKGFPVRKALERSVLFSSRICYNRVQGRILLPVRSGEKAAKQFGLTGISGSEVLRIF
jgi:hypothetical protein